MCSNQIFANTWHRSIFPFFVATTRVTFEEATLPVEQSAARGPRPHLSFQASTAARTAMMMSTAARAAIPAMTATGKPGKTIPTVVLRVPPTPREFQLDFRQISQVWFTLERVNRSTWIVTATLTVCLLPIWLNT